MIGGTKQGELDRSVELIKQINNEQGLYFVIMFLIDIGYSIDEIKQIADRLKPKSMG